MKARAGQTTNSANFLYDINASGSINSSDISTIKARAGSVLVTGGAVAIISAAPLPATTDLTYCHPFTASETIPPGGWTMSANAPVWVTVGEVRRGRRRRSADDGNCAASDEGRSGPRLDGRDVGRIDAPGRINIVEEVSGVCSLPRPRFHGTDIARVHSPRVVDIANQKSHRDGWQTDRTGDIR